MSAIPEKMFLAEQKAGYAQLRIENAKRNMATLEAKMEELAECSDVLVAAISEFGDLLASTAKGEYVDTQREKNESVLEAVVGFSGAMEAVASLEGMKAGQLRNEQLMLQSFPSYCRRAMVQLGLYRKTEAQTDAKFSAVEAHTGRKKLLFQAELDADELYGERALRGMIKENQDFENMRVSQLRQVLGGWCHLNMQLHARAMAKFCEVAGGLAEGGGRALEAQTIEKVVGLQEGRPDAHMCELFLEGLDEIRERGENLGGSEEVDKKNALFEKLYQK